METTYYLQVREDGLITDAITYPYGDYIEFRTSEPLPPGICGGWFKLENGVIVEYPELKPKTQEELLELRFQEVEQRQEEEITVLRSTLDNVLTELIPSILELFE